MTENTFTVNQLKDSITTLIAEYEQADVLLNSQLRAVINQDIMSLNDLVIDQVDMYEKLTKAEHTFKAQLQKFHRTYCRNEKLSLQNVLAHIDGPTEVLSNLRTKLHSQVEKTERLRRQLIDLLNFAQQQNAELFRAICVSGADGSDAYDARGNKKKRRAHGLAINQQA